MHPKNASGMTDPGPFRADQLKDGDGYELSNGHPIYCAPAGPRHGSANLTGGMALGTDPAVHEAGVDVGYSSSQSHLRAPDIAIGNVPENVDHPGWQAGAPPLAIEYADRGSDEANLQQKIIELHTAGTQWVWVVRLAASPKFVEVHPNGKPMYIVDQDGELEAKGILANKYPVRALFEREVANRIVRRNVLGGYDSLEAVLQAGREEGEARGKAEGKAEGQLLGEIRAYCEVFAITLTESRESALANMEVSGLRGLLDHVKNQRSWPD